MLHRDREDSQETHTHIGKVRRADEGVGRAFLFVGAARRWVSGPWLCSLSQPKPVVWLSETPRYSQVYVVYELDLLSDFSSWSANVGIFTQNRGGVTKQWKSQLVNDVNLTSMVDLWSLSRITLYLHSRNLTIGFQEHSWGVIPSLGKDLSGPGTRPTCTSRGGNCTRERDLVNPSYRSFICRKCNLIHDDCK